METPAADTAIADLAPTLQRLRAAWQANPPSLRQRADDLDHLRAAFARRVPEMDAAIRADYGHRSPHENLISEAMVVLAEIDHARRHLKRWARPRRVAVGWKFWPARAQVRPVPVGAVGILSPWNYPVNLALVPLVSAIAAGNHAYLKPSEQTPRTSAWLRELLAEVFPPERVAVVLGGAEVGAAFAALPFDHLLFTGSTAVGRKVMAAAAPNLTPVTLELGGKSPALVAPDFPIDLAAARIASGKWFNAGQTCIAVDYVLVDAPRRDALVAALRREVAARFGDLAATPDYTRVISDAAYARLQGLVADARAQGAEVVELLPVDAADAQRERLFAPTLLVDPPDDAQAMQQEIFGPLLPIRSYRSVDEAVACIHAHDRPLALYPFSNDRALLERLMREVVAGAVSVNDTLWHFGVHDLPFGGIGPSGMGAIHGRHGFDTFSKLLPVFRQVRWTATDLLKPPYRGKVDRLIRFLAR